MKRTKLSLKRPHDSQETNNEKKVKTIDEIKTKIQGPMQFNNGDRNQNGGGRDSEIEEKFTCDVCKKELTHMNVQRRMQHINRCIDEQIEANTIPQLVYQCPFCKKDVTESAKTNHLKVCARSNGVTDPEKLIQVNKLMEKQAEERRALRLPTAVQKPKAVTKPKGMSKVDPDLQMALAISLSLKEESDRQSEADLFEFEIPAASSSKNSIQDRRKKRKLENVLLPSLMTVTPKERAELLQIKISQVLDEEEKMPILNLNDIMGLKKDVEKTKNRPIKSPVLWRKASCPHTEVDGNLFTFVASKRKLLSDIPGRDATQIPLENHLQSAREFDRTEKSTNSKLSDEQTTNFDRLVVDFDSMVGNPKLSDVTIRTKDKIIIYAHRFVLFARCLPLYEETQHNDTSVLDWSMVSAESARIFLSFLYTARIDSLSEDLPKDVKTLAKRYNVHELLDRFAPTPEFCAKQQNFSSPECISPELLPMIDYEDDPSDDDVDYCVSPTINSEITRNRDGDVDFKSPFASASTPITKTTRNERFFSVSSITTSDDNEIEASFTPPGISRPNCNESPRARSPFDDVMPSFSSPIISRLNLSDDQPALDDESRTLGSVSHKMIDQNENSDSVEFIDADFFGVHNVSGMCYSQPESFREAEPAQDRNISWRDYDDCNDDLSGVLSPNLTPLTPSVDVLRPETPILPLAERIKRSKIGEKPISDVQVTPKKKKLTSDTKTKMVRRKKQISASQPVATNITPKPNYVDMNTPVIREQLKKFGLRQLPKKKAIQMLDHIYEGTHPLVTDSEHENSGIEKSVKMADHENEADLSGSQSDPLNESQEMLEETCFLEESPSPPTADVSEAFKRFVRSRPDIHKKILLYEPINFNELHSEIKNSGLKIKMATLKELLDKQCITFTLPRDRNRPRHHGRKTKKI